MMQTLFGTPDSAVYTLISSTTRHCSKRGSAASCGAHVVPRVGQCLAVSRSAYDAPMIMQWKFGLDMTRSENAQYPHFSDRNCPGYKFLGEIPPRQSLPSVPGLHDAETWRGKR